MTAISVCFFLVSPPNPNVAGTTRPESVRFVRDSSNGSLLRL